MQTRTGLGSVANALSRSMATPGVSCWARWDSSCSWAFCNGSFLRTCCNQVLMARRLSQGANRLGFCKVWIVRQACKNTCCARSSASVASPLQRRIRFRIHVCRCCTKAANASRSPARASPTRTSSGLFACQLGADDKITIRCFDRLQCRYFPGRSARPLLPPPADRRRQRRSARRHPISESSKPEQFCR